MAERTESTVPAGARLRGLLDGDAHGPLDLVRPDNVRVDLKKKRRMG